MTEWLSLSEVVSAPGKALRPVAWRGGELQRREIFLADIKAWEACLAAHAGTRVVANIECGYEFACALFGAWQAGKEVWLPGDAQAATMQGLLQEGDICVGALPGAIGPGNHSRQSGAEWAPRALDLHRTRLVVYTSGSNGEPQAIVKHLAQLDAEVRALQESFGALLDASEPATTVHTTVPHQHIYGLLFVILWPLAAGRPFAAEKLVYPEQMGERLGDGATVLITSPAHLKRLPASIDWSAACSCLKAVFSSGGPLAAEAAEQTLGLLGQSPIEVFGSSETGGIAWRQRAVHGDRWSALPAVQWRVENELLWVRSPHLADDNWHPTADRVQAKGETSFELLGRADRIVKIEEKRVSLTALERLLVNRPEVCDARVVTLQEKERQCLAVVVVPSPQGWALLQKSGKRALNEHLRAALLEHVERVVVPRRWRYVHVLPANALGKSTEALLAALFLREMPEVVWLKRDAQHAEAELDISADLRAFDGHFPGLPILPGVAQLDWAAELGRVCFGLPRRFVRAEVLKFQRPILPGMRVRLVLHWRTANLALGFQYHTEAGMHASGNLVFEADDA